VAGLLALLQAAVVSTAKIAAIAITCLNNVCCITKTPILSTLLVNY
jgi:hypothetical protein